MTTPLPTHTDDRGTPVLIVELKQDSPVVVLDRPLLEALDATLAGLSLDGVAGVVLASASEKVFVAGADLKAVRDLSDADLHAYLEFGASVFARLHEMPVWTAAAINGAALGGGLELAMAGKVSSDPNIFLLPDIGEGLQEAEVIKWLVKEGDTVEEQQSLAEVETDKALTEIPSPRAGTIKTLHGKDGDVMKVGEPFVSFEGAGGTASAPKPKPDNGATAPAKREDDGTVVGKMSADTPGLTRQEGKALATPAVRRKAREMGIDINAVPGSGIGGRVLEKDLKAFADSGGATKKPAAAPSSNQSAGTTRKPMSARMTRTLPAGSVARASSSLGSRVLHGGHQSATIATATTWAPSAVAANCCWSALVIISVEPVEAQALRKRTVEITLAVRAVRNMPGERLTIDVWAGAGLAGWYLEAAGTRTTRTRWRALQGFVYTQRAGYVPGPMCLSAETGLIVRRPLPEVRFDGNRVVNRLLADDPSVLPTVAATLKTVLIGPDSPPQGRDPAAFEPVMLTAGERFEQSPELVRVCLMAQSGSDQRGVRIGILGLRRPDGTAGMDSSSCVVYPFE